MTARRWRRLLRGDVNADVHDGGPGDDTVSFATATPGGPNQPRGSRSSLRRGRADGDDVSDVLRGIENVVGSPFFDRIQGNGSGFVQRRLWRRQLLRASPASPAPGSSPVHATIAADADSLDPGLVLLGDRSGTTGRSGPRAGRSPVSGSGATPGAGCGYRLAGGDQVTVAPGALGYVLAWGDNGDDRSRSGAACRTPPCSRSTAATATTCCAAARGADLIFAGETGRRPAQRPRRRRRARRPPRRRRFTLGRLRQRQPGHRLALRAATCSTPAPGRPTSPASATCSPGASTARIGGHRPARSAPRHATPPRWARAPRCWRARPFSRHPGRRPPRTDLLIGREGNDTCIGGIHNGC